MQNRNEISISLYQINKGFLVSNWQNIVTSIKDKTYTIKTYWTFPHIKISPWIEFWSYKYASDVALRCDTSTTQPPGLEGSPLRASLNTVPRSTRRWELSLKIYRTDRKLLIITKGNVFNENKYTQPKQSKKHA